MLWDKLTEENYIIYVNRDIDLKIKVFELMENDYSGSVVKTKI